MQFPRMQQSLDNFNEKMISKKHPSSWTRHTHKHRPKARSKINAKMQFEWFQFLHNDCCCEQLPCPHTLSTRRPAVCRRSAVVSADPLTSSLLPVSYCGLIEMPTFRRRTCTSDCCCCCCWFCCHRKAHVIPRCCCSCRCLSTCACVRACVSVAAARWSWL